ncbi:MAG: pyruvate dehydrogenase complex dihydrolipoamide acetyltransferase [Bernardetiaceae bacterium]|nr:pyruvate dehydrogenase complex dihydrolipoamide acetyltransferase [Bernardetiaceae bacterium]
MATIIRMPRLTDTMEEGNIAAVLVKEGDTIAPGDPFAEVETDKATMEWESYEDGTILYVGISEGESVPVESPAFIIGKKGEDITALKAEFEKGAPTAATTTPDVQQKTQEKNAEPAKASAASSDIDISNIPAKAVRMRKMTDTMDEGVLANWLVEVGDSVSSGDPIAEVETDKATMDFETYEEGKILYLAVEGGSTVAIDAIIAIIGEEGADYQKILDAENNKGNQKDSSPEATASSAQKQGATQQTASTPATISSSVSSQDSSGRIIASPLAKKLASEKGYALSDIQGSGEGGRIIKRDIEAFEPKEANAQPQQQQTQQPTAAQVSDEPVFGKESYREEKVPQMRKVIAKRLSESKFNAPHFYLNITVDMTQAIEARKRLNELSDTKISFNDLVIKASAAALRKHPQVNASWQGDTIRYNHHVNVGVAVAVPDGLLVPVVRFTDNKSLSDIAKEVKEFAQKAKDKKLQPSDWEGSTFTISNLGMFGIESFTGIINPPDACILAVGAIKQVPVVRDGQLAIGNEMKMTLSCDHRIVDGAIGAAFLKTLKEMLEEPLRMLV